MATSPISEATSLEMHVELCAERYSRLEEKFRMVEKGLDQLHDEFSHFKAENQKNLGEIKTMLTTAKDEKFKNIVTSTATIIVGLLAMLGYIVTHLAK